MSVQAAVFSGFQPKLRRTATQQSIEVSFLDADSWIGDVLQTLAEMERLPSNWDSYGSVPPVAAALNAARGFLVRTPFMRVPAPTVTPVPGGGVGFHWRIEGRSLEVEFLPDGGAEFVKCDGDNQDSIVEGLLKGGETQRNLLNWVAGF